MKTSNSNYNWPTQPDPSHSTWKTWTKALQAYYTKTGLPTTLWHSLGQWTTSAATVQTWVNTYNPQTHQAITQEINKPTMCNILQHQTCHHAYYNDSSDPTDLTPTRYPVTRENQRTGFQIILLVSSFPTRDPLPLNPNHSTVLQK